MSPDGTCDHLYDSDYGYAYRECAEDSRCYHRDIDACDGFVDCTAGEATDENAEENGCKGKNHSI